MTEKPENNILMRTVINNKTKPMLKPKTGQKNNHFLKLVRLETGIFKYVRIFADRV
jgi:hypothetical protein